MANEEGIRERINALAGMIEESLFRETRWGTRGYNEEDVDTFLDIVVGELQTLSERLDANRDLVSRVESRDAGQAPDDEDTDESSDEPAPSGGEPGRRDLTEAAGAEGTAWPEDDVTSERDVPADVTEDALFAPFPSLATGVPDSPVASPEPTESVSDSAGEGETEAEIMPGDAGVADAEEGSGVYDQDADAEITEQVGSEVPDDAHGAEDVRDVLDVAGVEEPSSTETGEGSQHVLLPVDDDTGVLPDVSEEGVPTQVAAYAPGGPTVRGDDPEHGEPVVQGRARARGDAADEDGSDGGDSLPPLPPWASDA